MQRSGKGLYSIPSSGGIGATARSSGERPDLGLTGMRISALVVPLGKSPLGQDSGAQEYTLDALIRDAGNRGAHFNPYVGQGCRPRGGQATPRPHRIAVSCASTLART